MVRDSAEEHVAQENILASCDVAPLDLSSVGVRGPDVLAMTTS